MIYPLGRYNVNFDLSAMAVLLVLLFFQVYLNKNRGRADIALMVLICVAFSSCLLEFLALMMRNNSQLFNYDIALAINCGEQFTHALTLMLVYVFIGFYSHPQRNFTRLERVLMTVPLVALGMMLLVPLWRSHIFNLLPGGYYVRGPWYGLMFGYTLLYLGGSLVSILRHRQTLGVNFYWLIGLGCCYMVAYYLDFEHPYFKASNFVAVILILVASFVLNRADTVHWKGIGTYDALSTIKNRSGLRLDAQRMCQGRVAVAMLDIDKFKRFNDVYGHQRGDDVIHHCGLELNKLFPEQCYRYGGDEFVIITHLPAAQFVERLFLLRQRIAELQLEGVAEPIYITVGYCFGEPTDIGDMLSLIDAADGNLYRGKKATRTRIVGPEAIIDT